MSILSTWFATDGSRGQTPVVRGQTPVFPVPRRSVLWLLGALAISMFLGRSVLARGQKPITISGCLERDAAARSPVYKLITKGASGTVIYLLSAAGAIDFAAEVGHVVEVTGSVSERDPRRPQEEAVLTVRSMRKIADRC